MIQRGEGRGVGNGIDRERVDVVVDDRETRIQINNCNRETTITHSIGCSSGTRTDNRNHQIGHGLGRQQGIRPCRTPGTIQ